MSQLTGNEFQNEKGTQGSLLKWFWSKIYTYFGAVYNDAKAYVDAALGNVYTKTETDALLSPINSSVTTLQNGLAAELVARANGDTVLADDIATLQASIAKLKNVTTWDAANSAFPTTRKGGGAFEEGDFVQITTSATIDGVQYKAGDFIICGVAGATTVAGFGDVDSPTIVSATSTVEGVVKLIASLAEYNGTDPLTGNKVITKSILQAILTETTDAITTAFQNADTALQTDITNAYTSAISTALADYYTIEDIDGFLSDLNTTIDNLDVQVSALQASQTLQNSRLDTLESDLESTNGRVDTVEGALEAKADAVKVTDLAAILSQVHNAMFEFIGRSFFLWKMRISHSLNIAGTVNYNMTGDSQGIDNAYKINAYNESGLSLIVAKASFMSGNAPATTWAQLGATINTYSGVIAADKVDVVYNYVNKMVLFNPDVFTAAEAEAVTFDLYGPLFNNGQDALDNLGVEGWNTARTALDAYIAAN